MKTKVISGYLCYSVSRISKFSLRIAGKLPVIFLFPVILTFSNSSAQIAFRTQTSGGTISGTSLNINKPAGIRIGDILLANIATNGNNSIPVSSGWSVVKSGALGSATTYGSVLFKIVRSTDTVSSLTAYSFQLGTSATGGAGGIVCFSGTDTSNPFDVAVSNLPGIATGSSLRPTATAISTVTRGTAVILFGQVAGGTCAWNNNRWKTNAPGNLTLNELIDQAGSNTSVGIAWALQATPGNTGTGEDSISVSNRWGALLLALRSCAPKITRQPASSLSGCFGGTIPTLSISASGLGVLSFQWYSNSINSNTGGTLIAGATDSTYTPSSASAAAGTYYYYVRVSGICGTDSSAVSTLTVNTDNSITLSSAAGTNAQTRCVNTPITNITYSTTGATGATFSNLPAGISGNWSSNVATISGTPTVSGTFNYTVTLTGGCGTVTASGTLIVASPNTITLTSASGTNAQSICNNTPITTITYATTGATGASATGLPQGVSGSWTANVFTISGTPTVNGTFNYTVTLTGGCGVISAAGSITVLSNNTITLSSATGTNAQTRCINTAITNITYSTTGATGANVTGLPSGVAGNWSANVFTISGTPTVSGTFSYTVNLTGGCGTVSTTGNITVTAGNTITLSSAAGTNTQTRCINTAITNITYTTTGATGATFSNLPAGVSGSWAGNTVTISGTPTVAGTFNYTISLTGGCGLITATGSITVPTNNTITLSSAAGTNAQTRCVNTAITNITYTTTGATGATFTNLPAGVSGSWAANVVTISGIPTAIGTFNYTVNLTGGCGTSAANGTIAVTANNSINLSSAAGTNSQTRCINSAITNITYTTTGATGATITGLPAGVSGSWNSNAYTISGTPTVAGTFNYTVSLTGGCGLITAAGTITVISNNTITLSSAAGTNAQTRCINAAITNITYTTTGATGATFSNLPAGVSGSWSGNTVTISGTPTVAGTFNYTVALTGGCGNISATGSLIVNNIPNITTQPSASVFLCPGGTLNLSVAASGTNTFQWRKNNVAITGATANTYTKANAILADSGIYTVAVTNTCGTAISQNSVVKIINRPSVTITADYCSNPGNIKLTAIPTPSTGAPTAYTYLWSTGGIRDTIFPPIAGNYSVTITPTSATTTNTGCTGSATASFNASQELVVNGNFNAGNTGFTCPPLFGLSYRYMADSANYQGELSASGRYGIGVNANNYNSTYQGKDHTTRTGNFMIVRGYSFIRPKIWQQTFQVSPNTTYYFTGWAMGLDSSSASNLPKLRFLVNDSIIGSSLLLLPHGQSSTSPDIWQRFYWKWNSGSATTASFSIYDSTATRSGNAFGLDDISIGPLSPFIYLTSDAATDTQIVCINSPISPVTLNIGSGGLPVVSGLPPGINFTYNGSSMVIAGSPTTAGTYTYSISTTGCSIRTFTGQINCQNTNITLTSPAGTANQSVCLGSAIIPITYSIISNTNAPSVTGLPSGLNLTYSSGILTITGTPTQTGVFNYTIAATGGSCAGGTSVAGIITINALPSASITIDSCFSPGILLLKAVPAPAGTYAYLWNTGGNGDTISVTSFGVYSVRITNSNGCVDTQTINVAVGLLQTSPPANSAQNACLNTAINPITYQFGGNLVSYSASGLPPGVTASANAGIISISGSPSILGTYNFTLTVILSLCGQNSPFTYNRTGSFSVNANPSVSITADYCAVINKVRLTATVTPSAAYTYQWTGSNVNNSVLEVNTAGPFTVTATNSVGCKARSTYTVLSEISINGNFESGNAGFISVATGNLPPYSYIADSLNFQGELVAPGLYGIDTNANNFNALYRGHDHTTGNGKFMIVHGYPSASLPFPPTPQPSQEPIVWQQTLAVNPNTTYYFSAWAMGIDSSGNYASLEFSVNGNQLGNNLDLTAHGQSPAAPDNWQNFYSTWNSNNATAATFTIKNNPTGTLLSGGNAFGLDDISIGQISTNLLLTSNPSTDTQYVCTNTPILPITFVYGSGGAPTVTGLPAGVTFTYTNSTITISGTPTVAGTFNFIVSTSGCNIRRWNGQIVSQNQNLVLVSAIGTNAQTVCINNSITNITYAAVSSITGILVSGLPAGVSYGFSNGYVVISGTPSAAGSFTYTISVTGGCASTASITGTVIVNNRPAVTITANYCSISGRALLRAVPTPAGSYTYSWSNGRTADTTSVTASGTYTVTVTTSSGCRTQVSINVTLGILLTSPSGTNNQSVCVGNTITNITYAMAPNITGATVSGLPSGVTFLFSQGVLTISGRPQVAGTFNYSISTTVSCFTAPASTGTIRVNALPTAVISADYCMVPGKVRLRVVPTPAATYTYLWSNGSNRDTTLADAAGNYSVTATNSNGCSVRTSLPVGIELCINGDFSQGNFGFSTPPILNQQYVFVADSPNVQNEITLPGNYAVDTNANNYNSNYFGHDHTTGSGKFYFAQGFPFIQPTAWQQTIPVSPNTNYYFSAWAMGLDSLGNNAIMRFSVNGTSMGNDLTLTDHGQSPSAPDNWLRYYRVWNSGTATTATFSVTDVRAISPGNSFGLDDISIGNLSPFIYLASAPSTDSQTVCLNSRIDTVTLYIGSGNNGTIAVSGLPTGVTYNFNGYRLIIYGTPSVLGTFNYTVSTTGCNIRTFNGQINSQGQSLVLTSAANSSNQNVCFRNPITDITYSSGSNITSSGVTVTGLPAGVIYTVQSGIIRLSGTPLQIGTYNYTVTVTGSICSGTSGTVSATGTINVIANPTVTINSDYCSVPGRVRLTGIPNPAGSYQYLWSTGATTDTTTVDLIGTYTLIVTNSNGCKSYDTIPVSVELVVNGNFEQGNTGFISPPLGNQRYVYVRDSANYQQELLFPGRYGIGPNANNYNSIYYGRDHTSGTGNFMVVHGFAFSAPVLWQETVSVDTNTNYYFSAWAMSLNDLGNNARLKFTINDSAIGNILTPPNRISSSSAPDNWTRFYGTWSSRTSTTAVLKITNMQTSFLGNSFGLDDISFGSLSTFIDLVSPPSTDTQIVCVNSPIAQVSLLVGSGGIPVVTGLPPGVTSIYDGYTFTISGTPTSLGTFNYTVQTTGGCTPRTFRGQIVSQGRTIALTSPAATANQTLCQRSPVSNITFSVTGSYSGVTASGLPSGITTSFNAGIFTISGAPTQAGVFNYTVTAAGTGCPPALFSGVLTVNASPVATISSSAGTVISCVNPSLTLTATGAGTYLWNAGLGTSPSVSVNQPNTYKVVITNNSGCKDSASITITSTTPAGSSIWLGYTSNWSDSANWCPSLPNESTSVTIPSGTSNNPVIGTSQAAVKNINIQGGASLTINGQVLQIAGSITNSGILNAQNGSIELIGAISAQTISGSQFANKTILNLKLSNSSGVSLTGVNDTLNITGEVRFGRSNVIFNTNGNLVLRSTASGTARVANLNLDSPTVLTGNRILGNVTVERYIPLHSKAWQLLSTPTLGQTVNQAWQEGGLPLSNIAPGYGTAITSNIANAATLGFDFVSPGGPGMKSYNSTLDIYEGIPGTSVPISNDKGYMLFVRGDRSVTSSSQPSTATTLRTRGALRTPLDNPPASISVPADKFESVGNPYASAIDFSKLTVTGGIQQVFYLWDPKLTTIGVNSAYGLGGFQTFVRNIGSAGYFVTPGGGSYGNGNTNIESGSAFFVHAVDTPGSITFSENAKVSGSNLVFRPSGSIQRIKVNFYVQQNGQRILLDGVLSEFDDNLSDSVDILDAFKIGSMSGESISIYKGVNLVVERSSLIDVSDTIRYRFGRLRNQTYELEFIPDNFRQPGLSVLLKDDVLNTLTPVNTNDTTRISFTVTSENISKTPQRFYLIFKNGRGWGNIPISKLTRDFRNLNAMSRGMNYEPK